MVGSSQRDFIGSNRYSSYRIYRYILPTLRPLLRANQSFNFRRADHRNPNSPFPSPVRNPGESGSEARRGRITQPDSLVSLGPYLTIQARKARECQALAWIKAIATSRSVTWDRLLRDLGSATSTSVLRQALRARRRLYIAIVCLFQQ